MTAPAEPSVEFPDLSDYGFTVLEESDLPRELHQLAEQVRALVDAVAHTEADPEQLRAAHATVAELTDRLGRRRRDSTTMLHRRTPDAGSRYNTLTNLVAGPVNPTAPPLRLTRTADGVAGECTLNATYQGPPGCVHGGWIAALLDQAVGEAVGAAGIPSLTANLDVDYRTPTPLNVPVTVAARITGTERRKIFVSGEISHEGHVTAEATAVMVRIAFTDPPES